MTGRVVRFDEERGFGFISPDGGGEDVFVHVNGLTGGKQTLSVGTRVTYDVVAGERGLKACDVRVIDHVVSGDDPSGLGFGFALTEALLRGVPTLTALQVLDVRAVVLAVVRAHDLVPE
jgi:cold shock protein